MENKDLTDQIQENVFTNATLKNELRKLKGKNVIDTIVAKPNVTTVTLGMFKLDPLTPKVLKNKDAYIVFIKYSREHVNTLWEIVKNDRALSPQDSNLDSAYSSCGDLYTTNCFCSYGTLEDKIICDLDKTTDLFQESSQNCPKCGNPIDDSSKPSNDNTNVVNALQEPFVVEQDPGEVTLHKSIPPGINETDCDPEEEINLIKKLLYDNLSPRPLKEFISENSDVAFESFSPSPIPVEDSDSLMEEIDLSFTLDDPMPSGIKEDDYYSKRDILILEELISNDSLSLPENKSFHFDIPSSSHPLAKPPDDNTGILNVKVMGDIFKHKVPMPRLMPTLVLNQEKSPSLLSHLGHKAFQLSTECPMMIYGRNTPILDVPFFHFYPP
nr:hypothetical protein [Tanacetum cinerariifolium]